MRFFEKNKISQKIFYHNSIGCGLSINKLKCLLTSMFLQVDTFVFQLQWFMKYAHHHSFTGVKKWKSRFYNFEIFSKDYKRVLILSGKKLSPFEIVKITENLSFLGQRWHLVILGDTFFSKTSSLKITIIFEDLYFLTQRWRFWWK